MTASNTPPQDKASDPFAYLYRYWHVQLTTFRKNGAAVGIPVWFAPDQGKLYMMTDIKTGKVKRIHNNARVLLTPCNITGKKILGDKIEAQAHELPASEYERAISALSRKYGLIYRLFTLFEVNLRKVTRTCFEIEHV